ncbi:MAG: GNAT family N-acetyltransferase [Vicinamibacterales bacterium]
MTVSDWRDRPAALVAPLYEAERARWQRELGWDTTATWAVVEEARRSGRLPGFVLESGGRTMGWTFFLPHGDSLQVGALAAHEARGIRLLLERVLAAPEGAHARTVSLFLFPESAALGAALARRRFSQRGHEYLTLDLASPGVGPAEPTLRPWREGDETATVRLMADAYRGLPSSVCYAPHGRLEEWAWYVGQLLRTPACGTLRPELTFVAPRPGGQPPAGVILTTAVSPETAHVAQVAVAPDARGRGVGRALVTASIRRARELGFRRLTLMVADDNAPARRLYASLGFAPGPAFLYAARPLPSRLARAS